MRGDLPGGQPLGLGEIVPNLSAHGEYTCGTEMREDTGKMRRAQKGGKNSWGRSNVPVPTGPRLLDSSFPVL